MGKQPDPKLDAAALFRHMRKIGSELDRHMRWCFHFRADQVEPLEELGELLDSRLREFFHVLLQDTVEEVQPDGSVINGPPMLRLEFVAVVDEPMLKGLHKRMTALAKRYGVRYEGCANYSEFPFDLDMFDAAMSDQ
jgi:hypothetical protein